MSSLISIRRQRTISDIPTEILEDTRMRTETRLVMGYLVSRPDGWEISAAKVQKILDISEGRWKKARQEMESCGYLNQVRVSGPDGTFRWKYLITDKPEPSDEA